MYKKKAKKNRTDGGKRDIYYFRIEQWKKEMVIFDPIDWKNKDFFTQTNLISKYQMCWLFLWQPSRQRYIQIVHRKCAYTQRTKNVHFLTFSKWKRFFLYAQDNLKSFSIRNSKWSPVNSSELSHFLVLITPKYQPEWTLNVRHVAIGFVILFNFLLIITNVIKPFKIKSTSYTGSFLITGPNAAWGVPWTKANNFWKKISFGPVTGNYPVYLFRRYIIWWYSFSIENLKKIIRFLFHFHRFCYFYLMHLMYLISENICGKLIICSQRFEMIDYTGCQ